MKISFKILAVLILVALIGWGVFWWLHQYAEKKNYQSDNGPSITVDVVTPVGTITGQQPVSPENPSHPIGQSVVMAKVADFVIEYYKSDQSFNIALLNQNIWQAREAAEKRFLEEVHVSKDEACKLTVNLSIPVDISATASGVNYRLSFCPNGKPLPPKK